MRSSGKLNFLQNYLKLLLQKFSIGAIQTPVIPENRTKIRNISLLSQNEYYLHMLTGYSPAAANDLPPIGRHQQA